MAYHCLNAQIVSYMLSLDSGGQYVVEDEVLRWLAAVEVEESMRLRSGGHAVE